MVLLFGFLLGCLAMPSSSGLVVASSRRATRVSKFHSASYDTEIWEGAPQLKGADVYCSGILGEFGGLWRQDANFVELWVPLEEDCVVKRHVEVTFLPKKLHLEVAGISVNEDLPNGIDTDESEWFVEAEYIPVGLLAARDRLLVVRLKKTQQYLNWQAVFLGGISKESCAPLLTVGGGGADQQTIIAAQHTSFEKVRAVFGYEMKDVYVRSEGDPFCYFVGKVNCIPGLSASLAVKAQEPLIQFHASNLLPTLFRGAPTELLCAPGTRSSSPIYVDILIILLRPQAFLTVMVLLLLLSLTVCGPREFRNACCSRPVFVGAFGRRLG